MERRFKHKIVNRQFHVFSLLVTGFGLLGLTVALISELIAYDSTVPQYVTLLFIFILLFAFIGIFLLSLGCIGAIKSLTKKGDNENIEIEKEFQDFESTGGAGRGKQLQIIRPPSTKEVEEKIAVEDKPVQREVVKEIKKEPVKKAEKAEEMKKEKVVEAPPGDFTYEDGLQSIVDRYNTDKVTKAFRNWYNTLMMTFPDISKSYLFVISGDEGIELSEGVDDAAAVQVNMDSTIFVKMMTKQINPIKAYSSGNLEVKGEMKNMLKLRKLMF